MTTDQDLPMDGQSITALFTAKGIDVTPNKDQGVIKVFCCQTFKCVFVQTSNLPLKLGVLLKWKLVSTDCEASRTRWRPANDWRQSDRPLHRKAAEREEV